MSRKDSSGFLQRLRRDVAGNVMLITAAMMMPILAFSGCAVDAARLYFVKMRLQQACDAGVLAGRKFMTGTGASLDATASSQATAFFNNNFRSGLFGASAVNFTPAKTNEGQVSGAAQATVPMAMMTIFGIPAQQLSVTCEARFDVADVDIIFVLDTTGSMACLPTDSSSTCSNYVGATNAVSYSRPADGATSGNEAYPAIRVPRPIMCRKNRDRAWQRSGRQCSTSTIRSPPTSIPPAISATASSPTHRR